VIRVGPYEVTAIVDSRFALDGGSMFGVVPRTLWQRVAVPDEANRIPLVTRVLLVEGEGRRILVDTGLGSKWDEKRRAIFAVEPVEGGLPAALDRRGISPSDITDVILTHLHFDHAAGTTIRSGPHDLELTFSQALHHVQARHWDWAFNPTLKDAGSFRQEDFSPLSGSELLRLHEGPAELYPGVEVFPLDGHTTGMQGVRIGRRGDDLLFLADLVPTAAHLPWPYIMGFDNSPLVTLAEKQRYLLRAATEGTVVVFQHDPEVGGVRLAETERGVGIAETIDV
jgi:glyoxylase-like metal-dependent hydrolase (beta-lactamase superfamily II)